MVRSRPRPLPWLAPLVIALSGCFAESPMVTDGEASSGPTAGPETATTSGTTPADSIGPTGPTGPTGPSTDDGTTAAVDSSSGEPTTDPDSGSSAEGPADECDAADGMPDATCPTETPFCVGGSCVTCGGGGDCGALDPANPVCGADDVCAPCREHSECPNGAGCHLFEGTCLPSDRVFYVDPDANCGPGEASEDMPACTIDEVIAAIGAEPMATIHLDEDVYLDDLDVGGGRIYAIIGDGATTTTLAFNVTPTVTVSGVAYFSSIDIQNFDPSATGIASSGDVWLDDATLRNLGVGLDSSGGRVVLRRTRVLNGSGVAMRLSGDQPATLINAIIANNGDALGNPGGIVAEGAGPIEVLYSTIVDNSGDAAGAIDCGPGPAIIRNSIIAARSPSDAIDCGPGTEVTHSVLDDDEFDGTPTNVPLEDVADLLLDAAYEVGGASIAADVARWEQGDPRTDINGTPRPDVPGTTDYAGAARPD